MTELKTRYIDDTYLQYHATGKHELAQIYLKSEVDQLIDAKDAKILSLDAEVFKQKHHARLFFDERNYAEARLKRQTYKQCLDKAKCRESEGDRLAAIAPNFNSDKERWEYDSDYWTKWCDRWMELAERFKERMNEDTIPQ